jgi:hypothetical protein
MVLEALSDFLVDDVSGGTPLVHKPDLGAAIASLLPSADVSSLASTLHTASRSAVDETLTLMLHAIALPPAPGAPVTLPPLALVTFTYGGPLDQPYSKNIHCKLELTGAHDLYELCVLPIPHDRDGAFHVHEESQHFRHAEGAFARARAARFAHSASHLARAILIGAVDIVTHAEADFSASAMSWPREQRSRIRSWLRWSLFVALRDQLKRPYR